MGAPKRRGEKKHVEYLTVCCGFKRPFQVLIDGNFVNAALELKVKDITDGIKRALHVSNHQEKIHLWTTTCAKQELWSLRRQYGEANDWAQKHVRVLACHHRTGDHTPDECIKDLLCTGRAEHFFVATQDPKLKKFLSSIRGGAALTVVPGGSIQLSSLSQEQQKLALEDGKTAMKVSASEMESGALRELPELQSGVQTGSKFRRKKAKGPNPLAVRSKSGQKESKGKAKRPGPALRRALKEAAAKEAEGQGPKKRKRKHKGTEVAS